MFIFVYFIFYYFSFHIGVRLPYAYCVITFSLSFYCVAYFVYEFVLNK